MPKLLKEPYVQKKIVEYLHSIGWSSNLVAKTGKETGVDIKVRNKGFSRYWLIEVKGDAPEDKHPTSQRVNAFRFALGQIITRMHTTGVRGYKYRYRYGVGFPATWRAMVLRHLPYDACDKLNLYVFLVDARGGVELLDWRTLKRLQSSADSRK